MCQSPYRPGVLKQLCHSPHRPGVSCAHLDPTATPKDHRVHRRGTGICHIACHTHDRPSLTASTLTPKHGHHHGISRI